MSQLFYNLLYGLIAGLATTVGGLIVMFFRPKKRHMSIYLGFASGIMIGISVFELIPDALKMSGILYCIIGFLLGCLIMWTLDHFLDTKNWVSISSRYGKIGYFIAFGITLHNLPEGLAIGAGYGAAPDLGIIIALSIGLHNIPEGMSIALPLKMNNCSWIRVLAITTIAGLATPVGSTIGYLISGISQNMISTALGTAAGCMVYISIDELIPESKQFHSYLSNMGILMGFIFILILSNI